MTVTTVTGKDLKLQELTINGVKFEVEIHDDEYWIVFDYGKAIYGRKTIGRYSGIPTPLQCRNIFDAHVQFLKAMKNILDMEIAKLEVMKSSS